MPFTRRDVFDFLARDGSRPTRLRMSAGLLLVNGATRDFVRFDFEGSISSPATS
jgi:hypothetical protein